MTRILQYIKSLFAPKPSGLPETKVEAPLPEVNKPEPSCLAKGIAEAWIKKEGWTVRRKLVDVQYYGSGGNGTYSHYDTWLSHAELGIKIRVNEPKEWCDYSSITLGEVRVNDSVEIYESYSGITYDARFTDREHIKAAILLFPYPALKKALDKQRRNKETKEAKLAVLKELGCPTK